MKDRSIFIYILLIFCVLLNSCKSKPLSNIGSSDGHYHLYFYALLTTDQDSIKNAFQKKYGNFYIDNNFTLNCIKNNVGQRKTSQKKSPNSIYIFRLTKNGELIEVGLVDLQNNTISKGNSDYEFNINDLEKSHDNFIKLNSFKINFSKFSDAKKFVNFVKSSAGFLYNSSANIENKITSFNGKVVLLSDTSSINVKTKWENINKQIISDFSGIGEVEISKFNYNGEDSVVITMLWKKDLSKKLPKKYKIITNYSDSMEIPLFVYDIEKSKIIDYLKNHGISDSILKEIN